MKKWMLCSILSVMLFNGALGQYRAYHKEALKKQRQKTYVKAFQVGDATHSFGPRGKYRSQKFQGLQVISMNRSGHTHDDIYFIDENGTTKYHTIIPTAPINTNENFAGMYDSSNPSGSQSAQQAVLDGVVTMLFGLLVN